MLREVLDLLVLHRVEEEVEDDDLVVLPVARDPACKVNLLAVGQFRVGGGDGVTVL